MIDKERLERSLEQDMNAVMENTDENNQESAMMRVMISNILVETWMDAKDSDFEDYLPEDRDILRSISDNEIKEAAEQWTDAFLTSTHMSLLYAAKHPIKFENALVDLYFENLQILLEEKRSELETDDLCNEQE